MDRGASGAATPRNRTENSVTSASVKGRSESLFPAIPQRLAACSLPLNSAVIGASASVPSPVWLRGRRGGAPAAAAPISSCGGGVVSRPAVLVSLRPGCAGACGDRVLAPVCVAGRQACTRGGLWPVWVCCSVKTGAGSSLLEWMTGRHRMRRREMLADETKSWDCICCVGGGARV